jgi:hypothetical protein
VTIELSRRTRETASLAYGPLPSGEVRFPEGHRTVRFAACRRGHSSGSSAGGKPVTFWSGGILAKSPRCVALSVFVDGAPTPRHRVVRLGERRCGAEPVGRWLTPLSFPFASNG